MRQLFIALVMCLTLPSLSAAADERILEGTAVLGSDDRVVIDFPVGELVVEGVSGDRFQIEVEVRCKGDRDRCRERLDDVEIDISERRGTFYIEIAPHSKWRSWNSVEVEALVRHPARNPLEIDMGVGEVEIEDVAADLEVDLGVGEVSANLPLEAIRSVYLDAGIGETELLAPDGWIQGDRSFLIGSESHWSDGRSR